MAGTALMARKKQAAPRPERRAVAITIKGTMEWRAWVERGARHCRTDVAKAVDAALIQFFKAQGFDEPPPER